MRLVRIYTNSHRAFMQQHSSCVSKSETKTIQPYLFSNKWFGEKNVPRHFRNMWMKIGLCENEISKKMNQKPNQQIYTHRCERENRCQLIASICACFKTIATHLQCNNSSKIRSENVSSFQNWCHSVEGTLFSCWAINTKVFHWSFLFTLLAFHHWNDVASKWNAHRLNEFEMHHQRWFTTWYWLSKEITRKVLNKRNKWKQIMVWNLWFCCN